MLYAICKPLAVLIMKLLFRLEARGTEHVPRRVQDYLKKRKKR